MTELLEDDTKTIFSSSGSLDSDERDAVQRGEARGKIEAMKDRPEHYGNIGSINTMKYRKNMNYAQGKCEGCRKYNPKKAGITVGGHCGLPQTKHCIR